MNKFAIFMTIFLFFSSSAFAEMFTFDCTFHASKTIQYKENKFINNENKDELDIILLYDSDSRKSYLSGNMGTIEVACIKNGNTITFIQSSENKTLGMEFITTTTIFTNYSENGVFPSVHSRHNNFNNFSILASLYQGFCEIK